MEPPPDYCCAILRDQRGHLLLEGRPAAAARAGGQATCFGGHRETGESACACLLRELDEEIGWRPAAARCRRAVILHLPDRQRAWFYTIAEEPPLTDLRLEPDTTLVHLDPDRLDDPGLSPWHRAALEAWRDGRDEAWAPGISGDGDRDGCPRPGV